MKIMQLKVVTYTLGIFLSNINIEAVIKRQKPMLFDEKIEALFGYYKTLKCQRVSNFSSKILAL